MADCPRLKMACNDGTSYEVFVGNVSGGAMVPSVAMSLAEMYVAQKVSWGLPAGPVFIIRGNCILLNSEVPALPPPLPRNSPTCSSARR